MEGKEIKPDYQRIVNFVASRGHESLTKELIQLMEGKEIKPDYQRIVNFAVVGGHENLTKELIRIMEEEEKITPDYQQIANLAGRGGHEALTKKLIRFMENKEIKFDYQGIVNVVARAGHKRLTTEFIRFFEEEKRIELNWQLITECAVAGGHETLTKELIQLMRQKQGGPNLFRIASCAAEMKHYALTKKIIDLMHISEYQEIVNIAARSGQGALAKVLICIMEESNIFTSYQQIAGSAAEGGHTSLMKEIVSIMEEKKIAPHYHFLANNAALGGHYELTNEILWIMGKDNEFNPNYQWLAHQAALGGHEALTYALINLMCSNGIEPDYRWIAKSASLRGHEILAVETISIMAGLQASYDYYQETAEMAAHCGNVATMQAAIHLMHIKAMVPNYGKILISVAYRRDEELTKLVLHGIERSICRRFIQWYPGVEPEEFASQICSFYQNMFQFVIANGHELVAKELINIMEEKKVVNFSFKDYEVMAESYGMKELQSVLMIKWLREECISLEMNNYEIDFFVKAALGELNAASALVANKKINVNVKLKNDSTILHLAIRLGQIEVVKLLIDLHCNTEATFQHMTALHYAIRKRNHDIAAHLIKSGARVDALYVGMTPLHYAIKKEDQAIIEMLVSSSGVNLESKYKGMTCLHYAFKKFNFDAVQCIVNAGANKSIPFDLFRRVMENCYISQRDAIVKFLPFCVIEGFALSDLIGETNFCALSSDIDELLKSDGALDLPEINNYISPIKLEALRIIEAAKEAGEYQDSLLIGNEAVMEDSKVARANWQFNNKVKPYFDEMLLNYSSTQNRDDAIAVIEKKVRELVLTVAAYEAKAAKNQQLLDFVENYKDKLIEADDEAMKASCEFFTLESQAQAAWRGFNPHAPVYDSWPNLLTLSDNYNDVWTGGDVAHQGTLGSLEAYNILRERIAYYYLAVIDDKDGDDNCRLTRIENFIGLLSDIRNAHGIDDPSCYPGTLTRIADMGAFHAIAQLSSTTKEMIDEFVRNKALKLFQDKLAELATIEAKQDFYSAICELTENNANSIIKNPINYKESWIAIRKDFIQSLGTAEENLEIVFTTNLFPVVQNDLPLFKISLVDVASGQTGIALANYFNRNVNVVPNENDIKNANPFKNENSQEYKVCELLLVNVLKYLPVFSTSLQELYNLKSSLGYITPAIIKGRPLTESLECFVMPDDNRKEFLNSILLDLNKIGWEPPIENPYDKKIEAAIRAINQNDTRPQFRKIYETNLESYKTKKTQFEQYLPRVKEAFNGTSIKNDCFGRLTENLIQHLSYSGSEFDCEKFCNDLNELDANFIAVHDVQFKRLLLDIGVNFVLNESNKKMRIN